MVPAFRSHPVCKAGDREQGCRELAAGARSSRAGCRRGPEPARDRSPRSWPSRLRLDLEVFTERRAVHGNRRPAARAATFSVNRAGKCERPLSGSAPSPDRAGRSTKRPSASVTLTSRVPGAAGDRFDRHPGRAAFTGQAQGRGRDGRVRVGASGSTQHGPVVPRRPVQCRRGQDDRPAHDRCGQTHRCSDGRAADQPRTFSGADPDPDEIGHRLPRRRKCLIAVKNADPRRFGPAAR